MDVSVKCEFEEYDTGEEIELNKDLTYEIMESFIGFDENNDLVFTYRVKLKRHQFQVKPGYEGSKDLSGIDVIDLEDIPDEPED